MNHRYRRPAGIISLLFMTQIVFLFPAGAQESIIQQMLQTEESVVSVIADNARVFKSPPTGAVINPATGQVAVARNISRASYRRAGAGVIVHRSGLIITNAHTVNLADRIQVVIKDQPALPAQVVRLVPDSDLAILNVASPWPLIPVPLADSNQIQLGDDVITIGSSELLKQTVSGGKIIGLGRSRSASQHGQTRNDLIQTTINLYQGDSGGPLFNRMGQLIGLMTAKETGADHSSFAIPSNQIMRQLIAYLNAAQANPTAAGPD